MSVTTKLCRIVPYLDWLLPIKSHKAFDYGILQGHVTNRNYYNLTAAVPMFTKLGKMMTFLEGFLTIKHFDHAQDHVTN